MKTIIRSTFFIITACALFLLISCAPNAAMTRSDGMAGHDMGGDASRNTTQEDERYASNDDFDVESNDLDAEESSVKSPRAKPRSSGGTAKAAPRVKASTTADDAESDVSSEEASGSDKYYQTGISSWYGREFHGRKTASGEKFDMNELTAAHRTLPLGSVVLVKNLDNGKIVKVRINDRGPFKGKRILDLSYAAAKKLDMVGAGEARVGIKVLGAASRDYASNDSTSDEEASGLTDTEPVRPIKKKSGAIERESHSGGVSIQAGAFYSRKNADKLKDRISEILPDYDVEVERDGDLFKVRVTGIESSKEAEKFKRKLTREEIDAFVVE